MPPQHLNAKSIFEELEEHNEYFGDIADAIPSYRDNDASVDDQPSSNQKGSSKKQKGKLKNSKKKVQDQDDDENDEDFMKDIKLVDKHEEDLDGQSPPTQPGSKNKNTKPDTEDAPKQSPSPHQTRIEDLKAKLRAKLEERRLNTVTNSTSHTIVSKRAARRSEKKRRIELAKKKRAQSIAGKTVTGNKNGVAAIKIVPKDLGGSKINASTSTKPIDVMDDLAGIDFGSIAGLKDGLLSHGNYSGVNKSLKNMGKKKSLERLLEEAEAKKERLRQLKESDNIEDKEKAKKIEWGDTLKAANGQKTRMSNPALLKKEMKRKAKKKAKSQEAWKSRMEQTKDKMDDRMSIRNHNIKQRAIGGMAGANLSKKRIKDDEKKETDGVGGKEGGDKKKRPRLGPHAGRAGFEGKKQDFINKGKGNGKKDVKSQ